GVLAVAADLCVARREDLRDLVTSRVGDAPQAIARANHLIQLDLPPEDTIGRSVDGAEPPPPRLRARARDGIGRQNAEVAGDGADPFLVVGDVLGPGDASAANLALDQRDTQAGHRGDETPGQSVEADEVGEPRGTGGL